MYTCEVHTVNSALEVWHTDTRHIASYHSHIPLLAIGFHRHNDIEVQ